MAESRRFRTFLPSPPNAEVRPKLPFAICEGSAADDLKRIPRMQGSRALGISGTRDAADISKPPLTR